MDRQSCPDALPSHPHSCAICDIKQTFSAIAASWLCPVSLLSSIFFLSLYLEKKSWHPQYTGRRRCERYQARWMTWSMPWRLAQSLYQHRNPYLMLLHHYVCHSSSSKVCSYILLNTYVRKQICFVSSVQ